MAELRPDPDFDAAAVEQLGAKQLTELIVKEAYRNAGVAQALRLAVAFLQSDDMLAEALADECRMLRRDDRFYDYRGRVADDVEIGSAESPVWARLRG